MKKFVAFLVAGYPSMEKSKQFIETLIEEGVDILELGVPFSDAMADGPVIQEASAKAAAAGVTLKNVLGLSREIKDKYPKLRIVLFTYFNPIHKMGVKKFAEQAKTNKVDAVLTVDLPVEEAGELKSALKESGVGTVFLASPTTNPDRMKLIDQASTEFVYYVSRTGVTGTQSQLSTTLESELAALRRVVSKPVYVGFGISNGEQAGAVAKIADGVVVGSRFVKISDREELRAVAKELKAAIISTYGQ